MYDSFLFVVLRMLFKHGVFSNNPRHTDTLFRKTVPGFVQLFEEQTVLKPMGFSKSYVNKTNPLRDDT